MTSLSESSQGEVGRFFGSASSSKSADRGRSIIQVRILWECQQSWALGMRQHQQPLQSR